MKSRYKNICLSYGLVVLTSVLEEYIPETPPSEDRETPEPEKKNPEAEATITGKYFFSPVPVNQKPNNSRTFILSTSVYRILETQKTAEPHILWDSAALKKR
ncbi:hypothetical protein D7X48_22435 [bacterium D16-50]|nr:hypothetical protein D7X48_22435 [bacterium D16-50]